MDAKREHRLRFASMAEWRGRWARLVASAPMRRARVIAASVVALIAVPAAAFAFDAGLEAKNFAKILEREHYITLTPEFQARLAQQNLDSQQEDLHIQATDPARNYTANICGHRTNECAGDVRFYDWQKQGFGLRTPVLFTARDGATLSGNVWATNAGPSKRPAVVITTGSVQAPETLYWGLAATLAKHGYVVLTYDVQGQGRSDTLGESPDALEGVPSQEGQPFFDGTEDALDFLLSTKNHPYEPRDSCGNANGGVGTSHAAKQDDRVKAGLNAAYNPFYKLVDAKRIGIAGHSLGASAVSFVGQEDKRVDAIVAWDNLSAPGQGAFGGQTCPSAPNTREDPKITKPAMGMSNDYFLTPQPYTSDPDPLSHNQGFLAYKKAGVDSMEVNTRGGTHYEYSFLPGETLPYPFGTATLRGNDMAAWYTTAWMDRYVKCQGEKACKADADRRLLTNRWRDDSLEGQVDTNGDPNLYSFYLRSQYDFHRANGKKAICNDMRKGCASMKPDGLPPDYSLVADAMRPDRGTGGTPESCALPQAGTRGNDRLKGTDAGDALHGRRGKDHLSGGPAGDCLYGGPGRDVLRGGPGADRLIGGRGNDRLISSEPGNDVVRCGPGRSDHARVSSGDRVSGCERVHRAGG
jgi:dienelactone hydrolase